MEITYTKSASVNGLMEAAWEAFAVYRQTSLQTRAALMREIALQLEALGDAWLHTAMEETHLPEARLRGERARTIFQLNSYADACERGDWLEACIDTAIPDKAPPKPDLRKMRVGIGPVLVFGASNFPYAYSTAGGDTATALAAGCPVIVKAHPAHPRTSTMAAAAIATAVEKMQLPAAVFTHVHDDGLATTHALIQHPYTKAVGFTGSYQGGKAIFDMANQRKEPIPVFAEMGSINPVFLFPEKLATEAATIAQMYAGSITLGMGQFCTNPGLIIGIASPALNEFIQTLGKAIEQVAPAPMLHAGIAANYEKNRLTALGVTGVTVATAAVSNEDGLLPTPTIATTSATNFLAQPQLQEEVFGPYSLVVQCADMNEMLAVANQIHGQLTATCMATEAEAANSTELVQQIQQLCGRIIFNGVPTGVEVCLSMQHGGPFPASTDSRFGSVGADGIKRFSRPIAFQNWPDALLPDALKRVNPLNIWRTVNDQLTKAPA